MASPRPLARRHHAPGDVSDGVDVAAGCPVAATGARLPPAINDDTAAALLLKGLTADYLLHDLGHVGPGARVLVHAAAGGVGLLVCAWARRLGAIVIGTASSDDKARLAREYGCEHVSSRATTASPTKCNAPSVAPTC
jgi:NADPH:quinone reductase-like Zn-dependent oxidoreductase